MRFSYAPTLQHSLHSLSEKLTEVQSVKISDELIVDMAPDAPFTASNC